MSRLTVRGATSQIDINRLLELSNDNQFGRNEAYYKLQHYEDLEEQGRLIERKHGRWIHKDNFIGKYLMCSECSHVTGRKGNYCPNCGAKMDGKKVE